MTLNGERVAVLLGRLNDNIQFLRSHRSLSKEKLVVDKLARHGIERGFQIAIESALSLAEHIVSRRKLGRPNDCGHTFQLLYEANIINESLMQNMKIMVKFRNRLVHIYWDIDVEMLHQYLQEDVAILETFAATITELTTEKE